MRDHLANTPANAKYTSPTIQNEVADTLGTQIKSKILDRVRRAQFFSLSADEVIDCSNMKHMANNLQIREDLVEFIEYDTGVSGHAKQIKLLDSFSRMVLILACFEARRMIALGTWHGRQMEQLP